MEPVLVVSLLFGLFAATHLGLAHVPIRQAFVQRAGRWGFVWLYSCIAAVSFGAAVAYAALHLDEGPSGLALGRFEVARALLVTASVLGLTLMAGSLGEYSRSPYVPRGDAIREPRGLQRVTRHAFFVGLGLLGGAHALLATKLVGAITMGALAAIALAGAHLQDRKLLALRGEPYASYLAQTSLVPFAAALEGRTRIVWRELPLAGLACGLALAFVLRAVHAQLYAHAGLFVIVPTVGGAFFLLVSEWRGERRHGEAISPATRGVAPGGRA